MFSLPRLHELLNIKYKDEYESFLGCLEHQDLIRRSSDGSRRLKGCFDGKTHMVFMMKADGEPTAERVLQLLSMVGQQQHNMRQVGQQQQQQCSQDMQAVAAFNSSLSCSGSLHHCRRPTLDFEAGQQQLNVPLGMSATAEPQPDDVTSSSGSCGADQQQRYASMAVAADTVAAAPGRSSTRCGVEPAEQQVR